MPWILGAAGVSLLGGAIMGNQQKVAANKAADAAAKAANVDIAQLDEQTRAIAKQNALDAQGLERMLTPEVPKLRTAANLGVLGSMGQDADVAAARQRVAANGAIPLDSPLLREAIAKARSNLALGGKLSLDQQNAAVRAGAGQAAAAGGGALGLGRDLAARDLGLTSYQVEQDRLNQASKLGGQEADLNALGSTHLLNTLQALRSASDSQFGRYMSAAQYGQSIAQPIVGLDPTAIANIKTGNASNAANALSNKAMIAGQGANQWLGLGGNLAGGLLAYGALSGAGAGTPAWEAGNGGTAAVMNAGLCWVAREVYGEDNPKWTQFQDWMIHRAPSTLFYRYAIYGQRLAKMIHNDPSAKDAIRAEMDSILA